VQNEKKTTVGGKVIFATMLIGWKSEKHMNNLGPNKKTAKLISSWFWRTGQNGQGSRETGKIPSIATEGRVSMVYQDGRCRERSKDDPEKEFPPIGKKRPTTSDKSKKGVSRKKRGGEKARNVKCELRLVTQGWEYKL